MRENFEQINDTVVCTLVQKGKKYVGVARCHPLDKDMQSTLIGETISHSRACGVLLRERLAESKQKLKILEDFLKSLADSKGYKNEFNSYTARKLRREIYETKKIITNLTNAIQTHEENTQRYIDNKQEFQDKVREKRKGDN